jgi:hypothetical protein
MHWPCGQLSLKPNSPPEEKGVLAAWTEPKSLGILQGSPVNCLVVPWADGSANQKAHQEALAPLLDAGRRAGLSFVGTIAGKQDVASVVATGVEAGLAGLMVESLEGLPKDAPVILRAPRSLVAWETVTPDFSLTDNLWPKLGLDKPKDGDEANAGPTGVPWVNSNGWMSLLARELSGGKAVWMEYEPPETSDLDHPAGYALAVSDACAYGSRWVVSLDPPFRRGLVQQDPRAARTWEGLRAALQFFQGKEAWSDYRPEGVLGIVSDFRGDNEFMATEVLNLLARRLVQYRIIEKSKILSANFRGLKAILWVDAAEPDAAAKSRMRTFVEQGGLLIAPRLWWALTSKPTPGGLLGRYRVFALGRGSHAVPVQETGDPYELAVDTHLLLSRRNDLVRIFNITACNVLVTGSAAAGKRLVQILNYASQGQPYLPSVWVRDGAPKARLWVLGEAESAVIEGVPAHGGREYQLPFISTYAALEFDARGV